MDELFYIETKSYWKDAYGTDYQVADCGDLPIIYRSLKEALRRVDNMVKLYTETMNYQVAIPNDSFPGVGTQYHYACRLEKADPQIRLEIRLYTIYIQ